MGLLVFQGYVSLSAGLFHSSHFLEDSTQSKNAVARIQKLTSYIVK